MSHAGNAERMRAALTDWNERGLRALSDGWWTDDIVWHDLPELPDQVLVRGREAVEQRIRELVDAVGHFHFDVLSMEECGELTITELDLVGHGVQSGAGFIGHIHQVQRWRDDRVCEVFTFAEREAMLNALDELPGADARRSRLPLP